jgi:hypothetical protein
MYTFILRYYKRAGFLWGISLPFKEKGPQGGRKTENSGPETAEALRGRGAEARLHNRENGSEQAAGRRETRRTAGRGRTSPHVPSAGSTMLETRHSGRAGGSGLYQQGNWSIGQLVNWGLTRGSPGNGSNEQMAATPGESAG